MDLSRLSTEDLIALRDNDLSRVSTEGLRYLKSQIPRKQAGFFESVKESALTLGAAPEAAKFATALTSREQEEARKKFLKSQEPEKLRTSLKDISDLSSFGDWVKQTAGTSAGYLVAPAAAATAGKILTKAPGAAKILGYGTLGAQYLIDNLSRQAEVQEEQIREGKSPSITSLEKAALGAAGQTALDAIGFKFFQPLFSKFPFLKNLSGETSKEAAKKAEQVILDAVENNTFSVFDGVLKGFGLGVAFEVPQEIGQQMIERAQAGLSISFSNKDAFNEYLEAAAGAALLGGPMGGAGRIFQNKQKLEEAQQIIFARDVQKKLDEKREQEQREKPLEEKPVLTRTSKATEEELTKAQEILNGLETDQEAAPYDFDRALIEGGIPKNRTQRIIRALKANKILQEDKETGLVKFTPPVEAPAYIAPEGAGEFVEEGVEGEPAPPPPAPPPPPAATPIFTPPSDFRYTITQSPALFDIKPLSIEDADFELETMQNNAERGRLTLENFAQSEIGKRLDTSQIMAINAGLRVDPVDTIKKLRESLALPATAPAPAPAPPPTAAPTTVQEPDRISQLIIESGAGSDFVKNLYSPYAEDAIVTDFDLDEISSDEITKSKNYIKNVSQNLLRNEFGDEVTLYRGLKGTEDKSPVLSYSLDKNVARFQAEQQGVRTGKIEEITVPVSEVLSYSEAIGKGTFGESEVIIPASAREKYLPKQPTAPAPAPAPAPPPPPVGTRIRNISAIALEAIKIDPTIKAISEATGLNQPQAAAVMRQFVEEGIVERVGNKFRLVTPEGAEGATDVSTPTRTLTGEAVTPSGRASTGLPLQREGTERPGAAEVGDAGVVSTGVDAARTDVREGVSEPTLTPEAWRERVVQSKVKGPLAPASILERINNLKTELAKYDPVAVLQRNSKIEEVVSLLRQFKQLDDATIEDKLGISRKATLDILEDLRDAGIITPENTLNEEALTVKDKQNRTAYDRFLQQEETPLQSAARSIDDIVDKYSETDIQNSSKTRKLVNERLVKLEEYLAKQKEREAAQAAREAETSPEGLRETEANAYVRAQEKIAVGEEVMSFSGEALRDAVNTKNADTVLEAIENRATQNQEAALSPESAEVQAEQAASRVRAPAVDTTGLTPEEANRRQREAVIRAAQERRQTKANVKADLTRVVSRIADPTSPAAIKNEFLASLAKRLRALDLSSLGIQIEGDPEADTQVFDRLRSQNKLAEYDPQTNTIYLRESGVSPKIILHEMVHAATVKILRLYSDPATRGQLNENQIEAAEHINALQEAAQKRLGGRFPDAFENVYEFVAYGMTDPVFQRELVRIRRPSLAKYTKAVQSLWEQFTDALMRLFDLATPKNLKKKNEYKSKVERLKDAQRIYEESRRNPEGNLLLELSEAFEQVLSAPEAGIDVSPLAARKRRPKARKVVPPDTRTAEQVLKADEKDRKKYSKKTLLDTFKKIFSGVEGYETAVALLQNDRRALLTLQEQLRRLGVLEYDGKDANNLYDLIALSSGKAFQSLTQFIKPYIDDANRAIAAYADATGLDIDDAIKRLSMYLTAKHEPERREIKFAMNVPLNDKTKIGSKTLGRTDTAAGHRRFMVEQLNNNFAAEKKKLGRDLTDAERESLAKSYRQVLNQLVAAYKDKDGFTPTNAKPGTMPLDINAPEYQVIGKFSQNVLQEIRDKYQADLADPTLGPLLKKLISDDRNNLGALQIIQDETIRLNREADYWSPPVDNFKNFYGYQNYVTFKGRPDSLVSEGDAQFELDGKRSGSDFMDIAGITEGRQSESDNVILTTLADGAKAAMRNGRIGVTQAIKNLINSGDIAGRLVKTIKFEERYQEGNRPEQLKKENRVFHYLPDGTIEVYQINDKKISNAIRRTYEADNPLLDLANKITSGIGQLHTRYNPAFYPYNFVRDALTNAFTMGAEMGPASAAKYIGAVAAQIGKVGMVKTGRVAKMYVEGRLPELRKMAEKDVDVRNVLEYLEEGGRVSYVQGLALQGQKDALLQQIGKKGFWANVATNKQAIDKWVDIWADSFEFTSRAAAYSVAKSNALARGATEAQAREEAAAYAKNIANFEQIGEWGKEAGALFMFFRPAATGAVRALDAIAPLFQDIDKAIARLPKNRRSDPEAVANFRKNFLKQRENARAMIYGLLGAGATLYLMAYMAADDDEMGRNRVATDDMSLWARNLRLPLGFMGIEEKFLQIPWGFGLGAFGAAGAQIMGLAAGNLKFADAAVNMSEVALDSFLPLPVSRINPLEEPTAWFVDSMMPSVVRPFVQFAMNVDGLGREIYLNRATKYGEAFTGGRNVPDAYKDLSRFMFNLTNGEVDVKPDTLYFWTNNYVDGIARVGQSLYGVALTVTGNKDFDAKEDLLIFRSYIGRKTNFDAREFASVERKIEEKNETFSAIKNLAILENDPTKLKRYLERNPNDPIIIDIYNKQTNRELRRLRQVRNAITVNPNITRQQRKKLLDEIDLYQNMLKRGLINTFKQYNVEP